MKKLLTALVFLIAIAAPRSASALGCDGASNCYIRAAATGTGTGADWTNAATGFTGSFAPGSLVRGVTYYVAGGSYNTAGTTLFNTPNSGTTPITIQAPTIAAHGTATGWLNSYVAQAVFGPVNFDTNYWVFNGVYRGSGTGLPSTDWRTGYGFKVNNAAGGGVPVASKCAVIIGSFPSTGGNNVTIEFVEIVGSGNVNGTKSDCGVGDNDGQTPTIQDNYIHDTGGVGISSDTTGTNVIQFNWIKNNQSTPNVHAEGIALRGVMNLTFAFNYLENQEGTGYIGTPCPNIGCNLNRGTWNFYGNVFFSNPSEWLGNCATCTGANAPLYTPPNNNIQNGLSYAWIQFFGGNGTGNQSSWTAINFYNNTIYQPGGTATANGGPKSCVAVNGGNVINTVLNVQNNLFVNCTSSGPPGSSGLTTTYDHNSYWSVTTVTDTGTGVQTISAGTPFTQVATNDLSLSQDTLAWIALGAPYNVDILGNTRTSSRGAFQFIAAEAKVTIAPGSLAFGNQIQNTSSAVQNITLTSTGTVNLVVTSITASSDYSVVQSPNPCDTMAPAATCNLAVTFSPTKLGSDPGTITITDNAAGSPHTVTLTGTGLSAPTITVVNITPCPSRLLSGSCPIASTTAGNELVAGITFNKGSGGCVVSSITGGGTWASAGARSVNTTPNSSAEIWAVPNVARATTVVNINTTPTTGCSAEAVFWEVKNINTRDVAAVANNIASSATPSGAAITTTHATEFIVGILNFQGSISSIFRGNDFINSSTIQGNGWAYSIRTATGTCTPQWQSGAAGTSNGSTAGYYFK